MEAIPAGTNLLAVLDKLDEEERATLLGIFEALAEDIFKQEPAKFGSVNAVKSDLLSLIRKGFARVCVDGDSVLDANRIWVEISKGVML